MRKWILITWLLSVLLVGSGCSFNGQSVVTSPESVNQAEQNHLSATGIESPPTGKPTPLKTSEPINNGSRSQPRVALTFDACERLNETAGFDSKIVQILVDNQAPATFFMGGKWIESHPAETRQLAEVPYFELGNHSYSHPDFSKTARPELLKEISRTQEIIRSYTGRESRLFRFPYGYYNSTALQAVAEEGLLPIQWEVVSGDPDPNIKAARMSSAVLASVRNGSIIIMHVNGRGWHTAEALPTILAGLKGKGYRLVTVSELLQEK